MQQMYVTPMSSEEIGPSSKVQLFISCRKLRDVDFVGMSDPYCTVMMRENQSEGWKQVSQTEMIKNTLNPDFERH